MQKEEAIEKGFTFEVYWNGKLWKYQCPVCFNLHTEGHTPACSRGRLLTKRALDAAKAAAQSALSITEVSQGTPRK